MRNRTAIRWARNPVLAALLLVAFCSRALIPSGFMPGPGGLTICDGYISAATQGMSAAAIGMAQMDTSDMSGMDMSSATEHPSTGSGAPSHEGTSLCPFAAAATTLAPMAQGAALVVIAHTITPRIYFPPERFVPHGTIVPTRLPRGPPAFT